MMELRSLRCFLALAEYLNYSRAADSLYISQPTMSVRIQELEAQVGTPLFDRSHHHVYLTNAGAALVPLARNILSSVDSIPSVVRSAAQTAQTDSVRLLRIGYDPTEDRSNLQPLNQMLGAFRKAYPQATLTVQPVSTQQVPELLQSGELDVAIVVQTDGNPVPEALLTIPIIRDPTVLVTYHAEGMTLDEILAQRGITFLGDDLHTYWMNYYSSYLKAHTSVSYDVKLISDVGALCFGLQYGQIVSFLPLSYLDTMSKDGRCVFETDLPDVILTLVWNKHVMNPAVQALVNEANAICSRAKKSRKATI